MELRSITAIDGYTKEQFVHDFVDTGTPVIIRDFLQPGSEALHRWNYDYFRRVAGHMLVGVHNEEDAHLDKVTSPPDKVMLFREYLDLIERGPTALRLFLFNLLLEQPELKEQLSVNKLADNLLTWLPFLFFGGEGSSVRYHYDIDMSHVFLTQFQGEKRVWLFENSQDALLYRLPYNFHGIADLRHPDYERFPALRFLSGWECTLRFGDTLYIPAGYWHYIQYVTAGYSVSYRALPGSLLERAKGLRNIFITRKVDNALRRLLGQRWFDYKVQRAYSRANRAMARYAHLA
jgi:hypothetical protein